MEWTLNKSQSTHHNDEQLQYSLPTKLEVIFQLHLFLSFLSSQQMIYPQLGAILCLHLFPLFTDHNRQVDYFVTLHGTKEIENKSN